MAQKSKTGDIRSKALDYHEYPNPGKLEIRPTKPMANGRDLSRAYSPGVADACMEIAANPADAVRYTAKGNMVAVISNGTAVLGLGDIGALASKPVMEGKAVLFKKFAGIDCFDIEVNETDPVKLANIVTALEPTFGAINLEDIKAPDCFIVEDLCRKQMNIPVFHDDQHGTAIVVAAAAVNAMKLTGKSFDKIKVASAGGGAAGIACLNMLVNLGVRVENIWLADRSGVIRKGRSEPMSPQQEVYAQDTDLENLADIVEGADLFLGLSGPNVLTPEMVKSMTPQPIIFALANPTPEIMPEEARRVAPDAILATGRSDIPNQVNNVLCFPFIFRGALDVGATEINEEMKVACANAIAELARTYSTAETAAAYVDEKLIFGPEYLIPKAFDPRLLSVVALAVARTAMETGVATRPVDLDAYAAKLDASINKTAMIMRPVFSAARTSHRRIVYAEGEDTRVIRSANAIIEESVDTPILIGRPEVIVHRCEQIGLTINPLEVFDIVNPENDPRFHEYWTSYHRLMERDGVTPDTAKAILRTNTTAIGAVMVHRGEADSLICGTFGQYKWHMKYINQILGRDGLSPIGALSAMILEDGPLFVADTHVNNEPDAQKIVDIVIAAARHARRFGVEPKIALCSSSQFGNLDSNTGVNMRAALKILDTMDLNFEYEGEMHSDTALDPALRQRLFPNARMKAKANVLIYGNSDASGATRNILKEVSSGLEVGPILMGMGNRAHIVTPSVTARGLLNTTALAGTSVASYG
ncbi:phosphate acetyltransferase [Amylibacter marinus]|uniref:Phosphate acetyltransferase n=1 Tax=Amylibacter marinus TaxID=1475483 RepID=A0ABQ5VX14_9RHOB|nr:NADP-dependent malic enzyme [Amylibacter marinus]GLQ35591.1 phosphate acetyltransferase [Amylibacter marinus]